MSETTRTASNFVEGVDFAFLFIAGISIFFLLAITAVVIYFVFKYREDKHPEAVQNEGNTKLEILWTVIPTILVLSMFYFGWAGYKPMKEAPEDSFEIISTSRMWSWAFEYPNGKVTDTLFVPSGRNVKLDLIAMDVIHSLYIPAFRLKQDITPGKEDMMWFNSEKPGEYDLFCAEYCGMQHSYMATSVVVMPQEDFDKWYTDTTLVATAAGGSPQLAGLGVLKKNGCNACHSTDGSKLVGPSYKGLFGSTKIVIIDGDEVEITADEDYIKRAIYDPNAEIAQGFTKGMMLSYKDLINEEELDQIIEYLKTLK